MKSLVAKGKLSEEGERWQWEELSRCEGDSLGWMMPNDAFREEDRLVLRIRKDLVLGVGTWEVHRAQVMVREDLATNAF